MGTKPDNLESRKKKLQTEDKVADENPKGKIPDALEGTFFDLQGSETKGYVWTCPMCKASNIKSKNISQRKGTLSFKCTGCKHEFDIAAAEESDPLASDELDTKHWGITLTEGVPKFRLGNWTTDGWYWDGGPEMILMFLARMMDDLPSLLRNLKQRPVIFSALVSEFEKAKASQEALTHLGYVLTGDNQVWHFGGVEDLLSKDFDGELEFFDQGFNENIREHLLEDPKFAWIESLSDEQLEEICVSEAQKLRWTPSEEEKDQICLEAVNDFIKAGDLDVRNLSAFITSLINFHTTDFEEIRWEIWREWGEKLLNSQWDTYITRVKEGLLKYKEEGDETSPPVGPNHPKLPFEASKVVAKSIPTRTVRIDGTPTKLSMVPGDLRRKDVKTHDVATCGICGRFWDDAQSTAWTPAPSGRCPFEYEHPHSEKPPRAVTKASRTVRKKHRIFECEGCEQYHPLGWVGDCRDDAHRYADEQDYAEREGVPVEDVEVVDESTPLDVGRGEQIVEASKTAGKPSKVVRKKAQTKNTSPFSDQKNKPRTASEYDVVGQMMAYEQGDLGEEETIALFQRLIDSGLVWRLQGHYGRSAKAYLDAGLCHLPGETPRQGGWSPDPMPTQNDIYNEMVALIPPELWDKYSHLSFAEMAEVPELAEYATDLQRAEHEWFAAENGSRPGYKASKRKAEDLKPNSWVQAPLGGVWMSAWYIGPSESGGYRVEFSEDAPIRVVDEIKPLPEKVLSSSKRKSEKWAYPSKEAIAGKLLSVCRDILENGEHRFSENNGWRPTLTVNMYERLKNAVTDAVSAGIGSSASQASKKESGSVSLVPVSRTTYSAYIRTLDGVQEVPAETPEGHSITILKGSKTVARAFYPAQGEPSYHVSSDPQSFGDYLSLSDEEKMDLWKHRPVGDEEPDRYLNHYRCPNDNTEWEDASPYTNNDRCPTCNQEIEPYKSEDI